MVKQLGFSLKMIFYLQDMYIKILIDKQKIIYLIKIQTTLIIKINNRNN